MLGSRVLARASRVVVFPLTSTRSLSSTPGLGARSHPRSSRNARSRKKRAEDGRNSTVVSHPNDGSDESKQSNSNGPANESPSKEARAETKDGIASEEGHRGQGGATPRRELGGSQDVQETPRNSIENVDQDSGPSTAEAQAGDKLFDNPRDSMSEEDTPVQAPEAGRRFLHHRDNPMIPSWALPRSLLEHLLGKVEQDAGLDSAGRQRSSVSTTSFPPLVLPSSFQKDALTQIFQLIPRILEPICLGGDATIPPSDIDVIRSGLESTLQWISQHSFRALALIEGEVAAQDITSGDPEKPSRRLEGARLDERQLGQFLRWSRFHHALSYLHLVITECNLKDGDGWRNECWERHLQSLQALSMNMEARLVAQVLLWEPRSEEAIREKIEQYMATGDATAVPPPGIDRALYAHALDTILGQLKLTPPLKKEVEPPCTIINISFPRAEGPRDISQAGHISTELMQYVASAVSANLLSLSPRSIAHVVGPYLGQDNAWASGPYSQLAYITAATAGRIQEAPESSDNSWGSVLGFFVPSSLRRLQYLETSKRFPGGSSEQSQSSKWADKVLDRYEDPSKWAVLKAQTAMESILDSVDFSASDSLIVHVDDFPELSMSGESKLLGWKLENAVNKMRANGKNVILVGTTAHSRPTMLVAGRLHKLAQTNTVINLPIDPKEWNSTRHRELLESQEYLNLVHNIHNLVHILEHMVPKERGVDLSARNLDLNHVKTLHGKSLLLSVLPQQIIFHLATVMVGLAADGRPVGTDAFFRALDSFHGADLARSRHEDATTSLSSFLAAQADTQAEAADKKLKVTTDNEYEEKLVPGIVRPRDINTTFDDVHVQKDTIEALKSLTSLSLERPDAFAYGILARDKISGCLLYGPPGTGKTLLAKAIAKDSRANVLEVSGASIRDMWQGNSEKNVRAIFSLAKKIEPCVIFLDEADAILGHRQGGPGNNGMMHRDIINQFLREWDGVTGSKAFVMIATNRPFDLDDAVLRRVPRRILVDLPLQAGRKAILKIMLKDEQLDEDVSLSNISKATPFYSGSDLKNVCVTAAMAAVKEEIAEREKHEGPDPYVFPEKRTIQQRHFDAALKEISSSISEDMETLTAIRKFDQQYGSGRKAVKKPSGMGFEVVPPAKDAEDVLVRKGVPVPA